MRRILLPLLLFLFVVASCNNAGSTLDISSQNVIHDDSLVLNTSNGTFTYRGGLYTGQSISHNSSGSISRTIDYKFGKKDGCLTMFYPNGAISYQANYLNGKLDGAIASWWKKWK